MKTKEFIRRYLDLFAGREDAYAVRVEFTKNGDKKVIYTPSNFQRLNDEGEDDWLTEKIAKVAERVGAVEYGPAAVAAHLKGEEFLGVYPIRDDSTVKWFALDFDGKDKDTKEPDPEAARIAAIRQMQIFRDEAKLPVYLEKSQSGNGYHIWGFLEDFVDAAKVRRAIHPFIESAVVYDRMFPVQDAVNPKKPYGNLIALPLFGPKVGEGKSCFYELGEDGDLYEIGDQKAYLCDVKKIEVDRIYELFADAPVPEKSVREREGVASESGTGAYKLISPYGCEWIRWHWEDPEEVTEPEWYALACQLAQLENGRELFHQFSARDEHRYNADDTDAKYDHAVEQNAPHTCEYIRNNLKGPTCRCDERFDGVYHPYDVAKLSISELVASMEQKDRISTSVAGITEAIEFFEAVEKDPDLGAGLPYGLAELDDKTGYRPTDLIIFGARPGMGKTAFMCQQMVYHAVTRQTPVYVFSMEMASAQLWRRILTSATGIDNNRMIRGKLSKDEWKEIYNVKEQFETQRPPIFIDDRTRDSSELMDVAGELIFEHGPGIIMIDYLQLLKPKTGESQYDKVSRASVEYKDLAKVLNVPVFALTQLNRSADDAEPDSATYDHWLRNSGEIEQNADVIFFLLGHKGDGVVERIIAAHKERHRGAGWRTTVEFNQSAMRFGERGTWGASMPSNERDGIGRILSRVSPLRQSSLSGGGLFGDDDDEDDDFDKRRNSLMGRGNGEAA